LPPVLSLSFDAQAALAEDLDYSAIWELVISFDVPQVDRTEQAFARMRDAMQALAEQMDGEVTDDNGVKLTTAAMDAIAQELERLYDTLDQRDLSAGSPLARRLFS
jgi:FtsZ-interacting cell division protein ZipA